MPLNSAIPLQGTQPQVASPIQSIGALMQLKGQMSQDVLRQAQADQARAQTADLQAQADQRKRDLASTAKLQDVLMDPVNHAAFGKGDYTPIWKAGISPNVAAPAITNLQQMNEKALTLQKEQAGRYAEGRSQLQSVIEGLDPKDDAIAAQQFNNAIPRIAQEHPELAAQIDKLTPGPSFRQSVQNLAAQNGIAYQILKNHTELQGKQDDINIKEAGEKRAVETFAQTIRKAKADATHAEQVAAGTVPVTDQQKQQDKTQDVKNYEYSKANGYKGTFEQWQTSDANRKRPVNNTYVAAAAPLGADGKPRPVTIDDVPADVRAQVQEVLDYNYKLPPASRNNPVNMAVRDWVARLGPSTGYSESQFANRNKIAMDFGPSGTSGKAITSADTGLSHLHSVSEAGKALKNGDLVTLNRLANFVGAQTGSSAPTVYDSIVETVAPEISKAVIGGVGGVEDRRQMAANFSRNLPDQAREGAIGATAKLLETRVKRMSEAYESDMGKPLKRKLSAESQALLDRYSGGGGVSPIKLKNGKFLTPHDQGAADAFRKDHPELIAQ